MNDGTEGGTTAGVPNDVPGWILTATAGPVPKLLSLSDVLMPGREAQEAMSKLVPYEEEHARQERAVAERRRMVFEASVAAMQALIATHGGWVDVTASSYVDAAEALVAEIERREAKANG